MPQKHLDATIEQVAGFLNNLKESLIDRIKEGSKVTLSVTNDIENMTNGYGMVVDGIYMGGTVTIKHGRPAEVEIAKHNADRAALMSSLERARQCTAKNA